MRISWALLAAAVVIVVVGLVVDATADTERSLTGLYVVAVVLGLLGMAAGYRERGRTR